MFSWFRKNKDIKSEEPNKTESVEELKIEIKDDSYEVKDNGDIKIWLEHPTRNGYGWTRYEYSIPKSSIISHIRNNIVLKTYEDFYNLENTYILSEHSYPDYEKVIEYKENLVQYKESQIWTLKYHLRERLWKIENIDRMGRESVFEKTPLEIFLSSFKGKYKLIETEDELNDYLSSTLDCDTWCRMKLYNKMKELGLGDGFINSFADLVGNDLDKYHAMIDLAGEVSDKDTLMYLYTYKFK